MVYENDIDELFQVGFVIPMKNIEIFETNVASIIDLIPDRQINIKEGQIWYNSTTDTIKAAPLVQAWASGGNLNTARHSAAGAGTQTAGLAAGGYPPFLNVSEEYNL